MNDWNGDPLSWRSIVEPDEPVVLLLGARARQPEAYDRYYRRFPPPRFADRCLEAFHRLSAFAFSAVVHLLALVLVAEFVYIALPVVEETFVTVQLYRPSARPDLPSPEPSPEKEEQKFERAAEAPRVADDPKPPKLDPSPTIGSGASEPHAVPAAVGVLENIREIAETGTAHLPGQGFYDGRLEGGRQAAVGRYGGNAASEAAVELGLEWLAAHQSEDGRWSASAYTKKCPPADRCSLGRAGVESYDHGVTGLALLAFLGAGYTHRDGRHAETVARGLRWLLGRQDREGFFFDSSAGPQVPGGMYGHGVCTFALGEACAMTRDPDLRAALDRAVRAIEKSQQPNGGWWYSPDPRQRRSEFTLSVWQMMGLKAAAGAGADVPQAVLDRAMQHVKDSTDASGGVYYSLRSNVTMGATGAGLFARCMFGLTRGGALDHGMDYLDQFAEQEPTMGRRQSWEHLYYWYYRTLVTFQMQGRRWREWNRKMRPFLVSTQRARGHGAGSWPLIDYTQAGMVYSTSLCVLMLETYYRYLPMVGDRSALETVVAAAEPEAEAMTPAEAARLEALRPPTPELEADRRARDLSEARRRLSSEKPEDRYLGARKLAELGDKESVSGLIEAARKAEGRLKAVHLLYVGRLKSEAAVPYLLSQLDDPDESIRAAAVSALMNATGIYIAEPARWKEWHADRLKKSAPER